MSCDRYTHDLPDVALGGVASADLAAHLGGCDACRAEVDRLVSLQARIERELGELMGEEPSPGFVARVRRRLDESRRERPRLGWLLPAAAALAVVLLGVRVLDRKAGAPSAGPQRAVVASPPPAVPQQAEAEATPPPPRPPIRSRPEPAAAPEVLVPKEQEELLRRLVRAMDEHPQPFASWTSTESESMAVSGIDVARIQVIPLKLELNDLKPLQIENEEGAS